MSDLIVSFGDSFIFGTELADNPDGQKAWPGLIAKTIGARYITHSEPGCSNEHIARQILQYAHEYIDQDPLFVINWTWSSRFSFYHADQGCWHSLGPSCVPRNLQNIYTAAQSEEILNFYHTHLSNSVVWNNWRALQTLLAVQKYLELHNIKSVQTYMDQSIFDQKAETPIYISELQNSVRLSMQDFQGQTFLDWSRDHGFEVTDPGWHPLEEAHRAAADLWIDTYRQKLDTPYKQGKHHE